ncbi:MAG: primosomal protein N' [Candidatus Omnitrophota bacterium]|jgi:primosomal protein N' (replication factor Y)
MFAQVHLGLPLEGPFDYSVPSELEQTIKPGSRVFVNFRAVKMIGYVVNLSNKTTIAKVKPILECLDDFPVLNEELLALTREVSQYYCCSWGEAIETALPQGLRKGKRLPLSPAAGIEGQLHTPRVLQEHFQPETVLIHDWGGKLRWDRYWEALALVLERKQTAIVLFPDIKAVQKAQNLITEKLHVPVGVLYREYRTELDEWVKIKQGALQIVVGTRSAVFAPVENLGLIIIDEEQDSGFKQDQVPHYHAREVALMRARSQKATCLLSSIAPSLESFFLAQKGTIKSMGVEEKNFPQVKIIDLKNLPMFNRKKALVLSLYVQDAILSAIQAREKILLFINRKGFATFAACQHCGNILKCPRCNINVVYHYKDNVLSCHYCNYKIKPPEICPQCNSGYIKYSGAGTEKIESELARLFPQAVIKQIEEIEDFDPLSADIFVATQSVFKYACATFSLVVVLAIDHEFNRVDFRSSEKAYYILTSLLRLAGQKMVIQTSLPHHYCFSALEQNKPSLFYEEELSMRTQLDFPPIRHMGLVKIRGAKEEKVKTVSENLFSALREKTGKADISVISVNPGQHAKLRGNFYWQIVLHAVTAQKLSDFLKTSLKKLSHSGIIVTVDIDPL